MKDHWKAMAFLTALAVVWGLLFSARAQTADAMNAYVHACEAVQELGKVAGVDVSGARCLDVIEPPDPQPKPRPPAKPAAPGLQTGIGGPSTWGPEQPFVNYAHHLQMKWTVGEPRGQAYPRDKLDPATGFPVEIIGGTPASTQYFFDGANQGDFGGRWVIRLEGEGRINVGGVAGRLAQRVSDIEFTLDYPDKDAGAAEIYLERIDGPIAGLSIFREDERADFEAGLHFRDRYIDEVSKYHVVRVMALNNSNNELIARADQIPRGYTFWSAGRHSPSYMQGAPIEPLFEIAMRADNALWLQAPMAFGAEIDYAAIPPSNEWQKGPNHLQRLGFDQAENMLGPEGDAERAAYAARLAQAIIDADYPRERPLYLSVSNEVWNWVFWQTHFAEGAGNKMLGERWDRDSLNHRVFYGAILGKTMLAVENALRNAGIENQNIVYVNETFLLNSPSTRLSYDAMKAVLDEAGEGDLIKRVGLAATHYWGQSAFTNFAPESAWRDAYDAGAQDEMFASFADWIIDETNPTQTSVAGTARATRALKDIAESYGSFLLGAYEGDAHIERPGFMPVEDYKAFVFGEHGAAINAAVLRAMREIEPTYLLSDYSMVDTGRDPWDNGPYGTENPKNESWTPYLRSD